MPEPGVAVVFATPRLLSRGLLPGTLWRETGAAAQPAAAGVWAGRMDAVIGTNQARHAQDPGRLRVCRAGAGFPAFGTRVGVRMKRGNDHRTRNERGAVQI